MKTSKKPPSSATLRVPGRPLAVRVAADAAARDAAAAAPEAPETAASQQPNPELAGGIAELKRAREALEGGLVKLDTLRKQLIREAEQQLVELALDIARKVLAQEIQAGRYEIDPIVQEALRHVPAQQAVVAHLHPEDWARCQMVQDSSGKGTGSIRLVADPSVPRAECVLETSEGVVHPDIEEHLDRIGEALSSVE